MLGELTATELRRRFANAFRPRPWIYWSDLLISASVGWGAFFVSVWSVPLSLLYVVMTFVAVTAMLRAVIFIHELAHLKQGSVPGFETAWNLLVGLPFMLPSLLYVGSHGDHHRQTTFGTAADPEYAPIARWSRLRIIRFVVATCVIPLLLALRWGILSPLSALIPPLRRLAVARASTLVINADYRRPLPQGRRAIYWALQEVAAALVFWGGVIGWAMGWISLGLLGQWYIVAAGVVLVNQIRTLAAHRYDNDGTQLDAMGQLLDSITLSGWPVPTVFAAPLGLQYHALHHWLPTVPYHSLGALHRQLLAELPADTPYRRTQRGGILSTVRALLRPTSEKASQTLLNVGRAAKEA
jgi:fatty acid desaturase